MEVRPPQRFVHPGQLDLDACLVDPREERFPMDVDTVNVNLGGCTVLKPPAWLWCVTYMLLARERSIPVKVRVPENERVRAGLESVGLFALLRSADVSLAPGDIEQPDSENVVIPLVRFKNQGTVHRLANRAYDELADRGIGRPEVQRIVSEAFVELAMNAVEHAQSPIGAFGFIQFLSSPRGERIAFGVADGGIGIQRSLAKNPAIEDPLLDDRMAVQVALKERISGTQDPTRGFGLHGLLEQMHRRGYGFELHSGNGRFQSSDAQETRSTKETLFPGTLAYGIIPT